MSCLTCGEADGWHRPDCPESSAALRTERDALKALVNELNARANVQAENLNREAGWLPLTVRHGMQPLAEYIAKGERMTERYQARATLLERALREAVEMLEGRAPVSTTDFRLLLNGTARAALASESPEDPVGSTP